jgi:hypothetical protein
MKNLFLLFISFILISCSNPLEVTVVTCQKEKPDTIVFNKKDTLFIKNKIGTILLDANKKHTFSVNNSRIREFNLRNTGGLLNIEGNEFVVFNVSFNKIGIEGYDHAQILRLSHVLIDSFLVSPKMENRYVNNKIYIGNIVDSILVRKNGNYSPLINDIEHLLSEDYDVSTEVWGIKKIGAQNSFIEKFWDYGLEEKVPDSLIVKIRKQDKNSSIYKAAKKILLAKDFLILASQTPSKYTVIDVRDILKQKN